MNLMMNLWDLELNQKANIKEILNTGDHYNKLTTFGFNSNMSVKYLYKMALNGPRVYQIGDSVYSFSQSVAKSILIAVEENKSDSGFTSSDLTSSGFTNSDKTAGELSDGLKLDSSDTSTISKKIENIVKTIVQKNNTDLKEFKNQYKTKFKNSLYNNTSTQSMIYPKPYLLTNRVLKPNMNFKLNSTPNTKLNSKFNFVLRNQTN